MVAVARELEAENYHDIKRITARKDNVIRLWEYLLELLRARRQRLEMNLGLQKIFQEMLYIMDWMDEMKVTFDQKMKAGRPELIQSDLFFVGGSHALVPFVQYALLQSQTEATMLASSPHK